MTLDELTFGPRFAPSLEVRKLDDGLVLETGNHYDGSGGIGATYWLEGDELDQFREFVCNDNG